jgi:hypothetical protein
MLRRRSENARPSPKFVAERFVFTPNPAGGYCSGEKAISAYYLKWRPQRALRTFPLCGAACCGVRRRRTLLRTPHVGHWVS